MPALSRRQRRQFVYSVYPPKKFFHFEARYGIKDWFQASLPCSADKQEYMDRLTMMIAWHKLSRYDRYWISAVCSTDVSKMPFKPIGPVLKRLYHVHNYRDNPNEPGYAYKMAIQKIERAALKQYKNRKRVRVKLEV